MTNEELAAAIQAGDADDLKPVLYDRVKHLMYKICGQYFGRYSQRFAACGVELSDYRQECYFAFLKALDSFKPQEKLLFTSYLEFHVKNAGAKLLGTRSGKPNKKPLDNCSSLDQPIGADDDENMTLGGFVADDTAQEAFEKAIDQIADEHTRKLIFRALDRLEAPLRDVIVKHYFEDMTLSSISDQAGVSLETISQRRNKALAKLRKDASLHILYEEHMIDESLHYKASNYSHRYFEAQKLVDRIERRGHYLSYGERQAIIYTHLMQIIAGDEEQQEEKPKSIIDTVKEWRAKHGLTGG